MFRWYIDITYSTGLSEVKNLYDKEILKVLFNKTLSTYHEGKGVNKDVTKFLWEMIPNSQTSGDFKYNFELRMTST